MNKPIVTAYGPLSWVGNFCPAVIPQEQAVPADADTILKSLDEILTEAEVETQWESWYSSKSANKYWRLAIVDDSGYLGTISIRPPSETEAGRFTLQVPSQIISATPDTRVESVTEFDVRSPHFIDTLVNEMHNNNVLTRKQFDRIRNKLSKLGIAVSEDNKSPEFWQWPEAK